MSWKIVLTGSQSIANLENKHFWNICIHYAKFWPCEKTYAKGTNIETWILDTLRRLGTPTTNHRMQDCPLLKMVLKITICSMHLRICKRSWNFIFSSGQPILGLDFFQPMFKIPREKEECQPHLNDRTFCPKTIIVKIIIQIIKR